MKFLDGRRLRQVLLELFGESASARVTAQDAVVRRTVAWNRMSRWLRVASTVELSELGVAVKWFKMASRLSNGSMMMNAVKSLLEKMDD
jgi:hypothetical protein